MDVPKVEGTPSTSDRRSNKSSLSAAPSNETGTVKRRTTRSQVFTSSKPDDAVIEIINPLQKQKPPALVEEKPPCLDHEPSPSVSHRGRKKKENSIVQFTEELLRAEPSKLLKLKLPEIEKIIKEIWNEGPYPCPSITQTDCGTFKTVDEACRHYKQCIKPMYMTFAGDRFHLFHDLPKEVRQHYIREVIQINKEVKCHSCGKASAHVYGMVYHTERCGVDPGKSSWKCWRCGFEATASESKVHLDKCAVEMKKKTVNHDEASGLNEPGNLECGSVESAIFNTPNGNASVLQETKRRIDDNGPDGPSRKKRSIASISKGILPPESTRVRVANTGQPRYRFRKTEVSKLVADMSGWEEYRSHVENSMRSWEKEHVLWLPPYLTYAYNTWSSVEPVPIAGLDKTSIGFHFRDDTLAYVSTDKIPTEVMKLNVLESQTVEDDEANWVTVGYTGGPIHTAKFAPNNLSDDEEVLITASYSDDAFLITENWKKSSSSVHFWIVKHGEKIENASKIRPWFVLESKYGAVLSACWLDVIRTPDEKSLIGYIALSTAQGMVLIYKIDVSIVPAPSGEPVSVAPRPLIILSQDPLPPEGFVIYPELPFAPPITRIEWSPFANARYLAGISASGSVVVWDLQGVLWAPRYITDNGWASPATDLCFSKEYELVVSFREKIIRIFDLTTTALLLEDNTVRTSGARVSSCHRALSGFVTFQSEYYNTVATEVPTTGISYVTSNNISRGYFIVPLVNRHALQLWDASISPTTAILATVGVDGQLLLSGNGHMAPRLCNVDASFSIIRDSMLVSQRRIEELDDRGEPKMLDFLCTYDSVCEKTWLEISLKPKQNAKNVPYSSLELRMQSLNVVATNNSCKNPIVVTGGQAGLLFIRPCRLDLGGKSLDPLELVSALTSSGDHFKKGAPQKEENQQLKPKAKLGRPPKVQKKPS